jgi:hypothetical protein
MLKLFRGSADGEKMKGHFYLFIVAALAAETNSLGTPRYELQYTRAV